MSNTKVFKKHTLLLYSVVFVISVISFITYLLFNLNFDSTKDYSEFVHILAWLGLIVGFYVLFTWYKLTGQVISLYTIFILFFFLFNYGQPLMWVLGIHQPNEIGQLGIYKLGKPTSSSIVYTQVLTLTSIVMFHLGAMFCYKSRKKDKGNVKGINAQFNLNAIFYTCLILSIVVFPITIYISIYDLLYSQAHGYGALYYDEKKSNVVMFNLLNRMFIPCLIGLLIGSNYKKSVRYSVYITFGIYMIINLLSGDRGSWVYSLLLLIYMSHTFYQKIRWKQGLTGMGLGVIFLYLVNTIIILRRSTGITIENIINTFTLENSPIVEFVFEMGGSMKPALVLVQYGWDIWPQSNTYLMAFIGLLPAYTINLFDISYESLGSWFSQGYLDISYGAGFSIIAEPFINFGPIIAPLFMILLGYLISSLTFIDKDTNIKDNSLKIFFAISTMSVFIPMARGHFQHTLNQWFYSVLIILVLIFFMKTYLVKKAKKPLIKDVS